MEWQAVAAVLGGAAGQWLKSLKNFPTPIAQLLMFVGGLVVYCAYNPPPQAAGASALGFIQYLLNASVNALSVNGAASVFGMHPGLKTDVR